MLVTRYSDIQTAVNRLHVSACFSHFEGGNHKKKYNNVYLRHTCGMHGE